jgi:hypothetical protein
MQITRSSFLTTAATAVASLALRPSGLLAVSATEPDEDAGWLKRAVGEKFYARGAGSILVPLTLERAVGVPSDGSVDQFSLYFTPDERYSLAEGTWRLVAASGGRTFDVFLVPAGPTASGRPQVRADFCLLEGASRRRPTRD